MNKISKANLENPYCVVEWVVKGNICGSLKLNFYVKKKQAQRKVEIIVPLYPTPRFSRCKWSCQDYYSFTSRHMSIWKIGIFNIFDISGILILVP